MTSLKNSIVTLFLVTSCIAGCTGSTAGVLVDEADLGAGNGTGSLLSPTVQSSGFSAALGFPASDLGAAVAHGASDGTIAFHGGAWVIPLPAQTPGTTISEVDATVTGPNNGGGVRVEVLSSLTGSLNFTTPPSVGVPVIAHVAVQHVVASGESFQLVISPKDGAGAWASGDTLVGALVFQYPFLGKGAWWHVTANSAIIDGGLVPSNPWSNQLLVGHSTTAIYPLTGLSSDWLVQSVTIYMAQTVTGNPQYDLVSDSLTSFGFSGFVQVPGSLVTNPGQVVTINGLSNNFASPVSLRVRTDSMSTTSIGAVLVNYQ